MAVVVFCVFVFGEVRVRAKKIMCIFLLLQARPSA